MTGEELVKALESGAAEAGTGAAVTEEVERLFVFTVGSSRYALPPAAIREIVLDLEVFPLPACPPYIAGLINCHGKPYTVFDLRVLFEGERQEAARFLVLNTPGDAVSFGCTDVDEIVEVPRSRISAFSARDGEGRFCSGMLEHDGGRIPVLSIESIQRQLENDLA